MITSNMRGKLMRLVAGDCSVQEREAIRESIFADEENSIPPLLELLDDPDGERQAQAIRFLLAIDPSRFMPRIFSKLTSEYEVVRGIICYELAMHVPPESGAQAVESLCELLCRESSSDVRWWAVVALEQIGDKRAIPTLEWVRDHDKGETWEGRRVSAAAESAIAGIL